MSWDVNKTWVVLRTDLGADSPKSHWFDGGFYVTEAEADKAAAAQKAQGLAVEVKRLSELPQKPRLPLICWRWWPGIDPKAPVQGPAK